MASSSLAIPRTADGPSDQETVVSGLYSSQVRPAGRPVESVRSRVSGGIEGRARPARFQPIRIETRARAVVAPRIHHEGIRAALDVDRDGPRWTADEA
ncbi:hypothetical protein E4U53_004887 [Claviceps sorghi]|nr:hypothetical protein E4U53_004887 [Claviceps sorghi]